ncbi:restriction endonuclease [Mycolicibacterium sp. 3033]|nr:restriction endonuclease [Mycolicibacterium aurantiacum]
MTRTRWRLAGALGIAAGVGAVLCGLPSWWCLAIAIAAPLVPGFVAAVVVGAVTPGVREIDARDEMSGTEFEDHVARIARSVGVPVIMTPLSGDWGVDLIVGHRPDRLAVQCKRQSRPVGTGAVQEVVAGAPMQDCTRTMVVTNHQFTPAARKLAELHGCELVGGAELPRLRSTIRRLTRPIEPTST